MPLSLEAAEGGAGNQALVVTPLCRLNTNEPPLGFSDGETRRCAAACAICSRPPAVQLQQWPSCFASAWTLYQPDLFCSCCWRLAASRVSGLPLDHCKQLDVIQVILLRDLHTGGVM